MRSPASTIFATEIHLYGVALLRITEYLARRDHVLGFSASSRTKLEIKINSEVRRSYAGSHPAEF